MQYKAILLDIDGTLVVPGEPCVRPQVEQAVNKLQQQGVKIIVATGRSEFATGKEVLASIRPDYGIYSNGACVKNGQGKVIFEDRLTPQNMYTLVDFCEDFDYPLAFCYEDGYYAYIEYEKMHQCYGEITGHAEHVKDGEDQDRHLESMPYTAFALVPPEQVEVYTKKYPGLRFVPYCDGKYDVFKPENTKAEGAKILLEQLGISPQEVVAVGDGMNDIEMFELAGMSYAMGNSRQQVQDAAKKVAPTVEEQGVAQVIAEIFEI